MIKLYENDWNCKGCENLGKCAGAFPEYCGQTVPGTKEIKIFNLTPHAVNILNQDGTTKYIIEPDGVPARCEQTNTIVGSLAGITLTASTFGEVENLPESMADVYYIVSRLVLSACAGKRYDLLVPNELVRGTGEEKGIIKGCLSLANK